MASLLLLIHSKTPSFWRHSPSVFMQNMLPKMFFDSLHALTVAATTRATTGVMLEGRLYNFPLKFATLKSVLLGAINRIIVRMHSLESRDMVSIFMLTVAVMAYQKIQKNRTGRTLVMNLFLRDVLYLWQARQSNELVTEAPYCAWIGAESQEELVIKCSAFRFLKIGSLINIEQHQQVSRSCTFSYMLADI